MRNRKRLETLDFCESLDRSKPALGYVGQGGTDAPPKTDGWTTTIPLATVIEFFD